MFRERLCCVANKNKSVLCKHIFQLLIFSDFRTVCITWNGLLVEYSIIVLILLLEILSNTFDYFNLGIYLED